MGKGVKEGRELVRRGVVIRRKVVIMEMDLRRAKRWVTSEASRRTVCVSE